MSEKSYTPDRRIVCAGLTTVGNALLRTMGSLRRSMSDELVTSDSLLVWDTGARCTTLNERIVEALGLQPTGRTVTLMLADGHAVECKTYMVYVKFTFGDYYGPYEVPAMAGMSCDLLVGMDIITLGELHVNRMNETEVEFVFIMHKRPATTEHN